MTAFREYDVGPVDCDKLPSSRGAARDAGLKRYFTGQPCMHGHVTWRFVHGGCVECRNIAGRNKERPGHAEQSRRWRAENPEAWKASQKRSLIRHRDRVQARLAAWRAQNVEHERAYRKANSARLLENCWRRRARLREVENTLTQADVQELIVVQGGRCAECGRKAKLTLDHIVPLFRGGPHTRRNAQMLCRSCNCSKGAKDPLQFAREKGRLI